MSFAESTKFIDKPTFFGALGLLLLVTLPLLFYPEQGAVWVKVARDFLVTNFGFAYLLLGIGSFVFMLYIAFSDIGKIRLGDPDTEPEFSTLSWAAMLFCAGIGASILYWALIEWAYYYQSAPFLVEGQTVDAMRWASAYGIFHWGPLAWSIYLIPALPIAYFYHVRHGSVLKVSEAIAPVISEKVAHGPVGKLVDVLFVFGMLGGGATSLGLAAPLINEGMHELFGAPRDIGTQIFVLILCTSIFGASAYSGLKKGIQTLSNINLWLALGLLSFVFLVGPTVFLAETALESIGILFDNFFKMSTWMEPFGGYNNFPDTEFPQDWTVFYWAWWLAFAPSVGLFIARISRGRTMGSMIIGSLFYGSFGCALFFMILGNYAIHLQITGAVDVVNILNTETPTAAIFSVLGHLPLRTLVIGVYTLLAIIFVATTFDSISYILASVVQKQIDEEPLRWNRLFWAAALSFMPIALLLLGGLETLQTASIVGGAPLLIIALLLCMSIYKVASYDLKFQPHVEDKQIDVNEFPRHDPWHPKGNWEQE
ncbi:MAG: BCCT family transporter [Pseudomonadota bacterium]